MLSRLFGRTKRARRGEDQVWAKAAARKAGLLREAERLSGEGASVVVVGLSATAVDELAAGLQRLGPAVCKDLFAQAALRCRLAQGKSITVALASSLPRPAPGTTGAEPSAPASIPVEMLVLGRHDRRAGDEEIAAFADSVGPRARVTFHLSFDDPLLASHAGTIKDLLLKLGMRDDEAIAHVAVTRAVEKAQRKA